MNSLKLFITLLLCPLLLYCQPRGASMEYNGQDPGSVKALIIGISNYKSTEISPLKYAHADAIALSAFIREQYNIPAENVSLLLNENATTGNVVMSLYQLSNIAKKNDRIIVYFSGHGDVETLTSKQNGFLLTFDTHPNVYIGSALGVDILNQFVSDITDKGARVIIISDACRSGKLAGGTTGTQQASAVLSNRVKNEIRLLACQSHEISLEGAQWGGGRGLFSFELIRGWKGAADLVGNQDGSVTLLELQKYLTTVVPEQAVPGNQNPLIFGNVTEIIGYVRPGELAAQPTKENLLTAVNIRAVMNPADSNLIYQLQAKIAENHLVGRGSAFDLYLSFKTITKDDAVKNNLTRMICSALLTKANAFLNQYLGSKTYNSSVQEIADNIKCLQHAAEILRDFKGYKDYFNSKLRFYEAILAKHRQNLPLAESLLHESIQLEPEAAYTYNELGAIQRALGKHNDAITSLQHALFLSPKWIYPHINLSDIYLELGQIADAIAHYKMLLKEGFTHPVIHENLAVALDQVDSLEQAEFHYKKAMKDGGENYGLLINMGQHYLKKKDYVNSKDFLTRGLKITSDNMEIKMNASILLGICNYYLNDYDAALRLFNDNKMLFNPAQQSEISTYRVLAYLKSGQEDEFRSAYADYISREGSQEINYEIGLFYFSTQKYHEALEKFKATAPFFEHKVNFLIALCYFNLEKYKESIDWIQSGIHFDAGKEADVNLLLGKNFLMLNDLTASKKVLRTSLDEDQQWEAFYWLSVIHVIEGDHESAVHLLQESVKLGLKREMIEQQQVFQKLKAHPGFKKIVNQLK